MHIRMHIYTNVILSAYLNIVRRYDIIIKTHAAIYLREIRQVLFFT